MNFLDEMKKAYGAEQSYLKLVNLVKEKVEAKFQVGKDCAWFHDTPENVERLMNDPEFEGFIFKESGVPSDTPGHISKLICWD